MKARLILTVSLTALLPLGAAALAQSLPPSPQAEGTPALILPPSPAGSAMAPQLHKAPMGIPGFYDPTTGKFTPSASIVPRTPSSGVARPAAAGSSSTKALSIHTQFSFDSALKPYNTLNCIAGVEYGISAVGIDFFDSDQQTYQTSVGEPPTDVTFTIPFGAAGYAGVKGSMVCSAEDDSGGTHYGQAQDHILIEPESGASIIHLKLEL